MSESLVPQPLPPAGWYPSSTPGVESWWDGSRWTEAQQPVPQLSVPPTSVPSMSQSMLQPSYSAGLTGGQLAVTDQRTNGVEIAFAWIFTILSLGYLLPWAIAATRGKSNSVAVALVNLFAGWTLVGWIVALVMACGAHQQRLNVVQVVNVPHYY